RPPAGLAEAAPVACRTRQAQGGVGMRSATMNAAIFCGNGRIEVQRVPLPTPEAGEVCVRLDGCGVCASNSPVWEGREWFEYPFAAGAPGHEGWGHITAVGDEVDEWRLGDRVALLSGNAYAEYDIAKATALARLPDPVADQAAPGEPLGCAMNIFRRSEVRSGQTVAIVGAGFLGILLTQLCSAAGARVIALSRRQFARDMALAAGAKHAFATEDRWQAVREVQALTDGAGCERVIEVVG